MAEQFAGSDADIMRYLQMLRQQGRTSLQDTFGRAQQSIGEQFTPAMRMAQARLGANPLLGDSGYSNRLNRQLQTAAFTDLSGRYGEAAGRQAESEGSALQNLINQRLAARSQYIQAAYGAGQKKKKALDYAGQLAGAALGAYTSSKTGRGGGGGGGSMASGATYA